LEGHAPAPGGLNLALWIAQVVFALAFGAIGVVKFVSWRAYVATMPVPVAVVFALGIVEVACALGLVAPALSRGLVWLVPVAAIVLAATAVLAGVVHAVRAEWSLVPINVVLVAGAAFIAWGRWSH
jgi:uncharacterized membrane protein